MAAIQPWYSGRGLCPLPSALVPASSAWRRTSSGRGVRLGSSTTSSVQAGGRCLHAHAGGASGALSDGDLCPASSLASSLRHLGL